MPVAAVSCGGFFTMVLTEEGQLWNWGGKYFICFVYKKVFINLLTSFFSNKTNFILFFYKYVIKERAFIKRYMSHRHDFNILVLQNFILPVPNSCDQMCNKLQLCYCKQYDNSECS